MNYVIQYNDRRSQRVEADNFQRDQSTGWIAFRSGSKVLLFVDPNAIESVRLDEVEGPKVPTATVSGGRRPSR